MTTIDKAREYFSKWSKYPYSDNDDTKWTDAHMIQFASDFHESMSENNRNHVVIGNGIEILCPAIIEEGNIGVLGFVRDQTAKLGQYFTKFTGKDLNDLDSHFRIVFLNTEGLDIMIEMIEEVKKLMESPPK